MVKRLLAIIITVLSFCFMANPASPLSYEIDIGQDGTFETGAVLNLSPQSTITVDVYFDGYSCPPDDLVFGVCAYILVDVSIGEYGGHPIMILSRKK